MKLRMKVLQTIRQGKFGGGETHVLELSSRLNKEKFELVVLSFTEGPMVDELRIRGIRCVVISTEKAFDWIVWKQVFAFLKAEKFDLIHAHGTRACSNIICAAKVLKVPVVYTVHGWSFHPDQKRIIHCLRVASEKLLTTLSDNTICVSKSNQAEGQERFNLKRSQVIYNAVDFTHFDYSIPSASLSISPEKVIVGYIVRITAQKNPLLLIEAWREVVRNNENVMLLVVGDGDLKARMIQLVEEYRLQSYVTFMPFRNDIPSVLSAIDIYCLPSLWEGFPIGILESMAMKKSVITTPVNGNIELVIDGETGLLVSPSDEKLLAKQLLVLINSTSLRKHLTENAYAYVREKFGYEKLVSQIEKLYISLPRS